MQETQSAEWHRAQGTVRVQLEQIQGLDCREIKQQLAEVGHKAQLAEKDQNYMYHRERDGTGIPCGSLVPFQKVKAKSQQNGEISCHRNVFLIGSHNKIPSMKMTVGQLWCLRILSVMDVSKVYCLIPETKKRPEAPMN